MRLESIRQSLHQYWWLIAVAAAAAMIAGGVTYGVSKLGPSDPDTELARAYRAGVEALARGDWRHATEQLGRAAAIDPGYKDVASLLAQAQAASGGAATGGAPSSGARDKQGGSTAKPPSGSSGSSAKKPPTIKPGEPGFKRPSDLATLLPAELADFNPPQIGSTRDLASAIYLPLRTGSVRQVQIWIADRKTPTKAVGFVNQTLRCVYPNDAAAVKLSNTVTAYFGTGQRLYVTIGWSRGTLAYQVLIETESAEPAKLKTMAVGIAKKIV